MAEKLHPVYEETNIKDPKSEIRVLTIRPSAPGDALSWVQNKAFKVISCALEKTTIHDAEPFEALSYTWGDDSNMQRISLNERAFMIRENLWLALKQLQQKKVSRRIWIDAICINQESVSERNAQVSIMKDIFSAATMVIAWIGPGSKRVQDVFDYCNALSSSNGDGLFESDKPRITDIPADASQAEREKRAKKTGGSKHLEDVYRSEWFGRIWILQEVAVARKVLLKCGENNIWLLDFLRSSQKVLEEGYNEYIIRGNDPEKVLGHRFNRYTAFTKITQAHQTSETYEAPSLSSMLIGCRHFDASMAHDKIYALYGLAFKDVERLQLYPQYDIPAARAYTDVTYALLSEMGSSALLEVPRGDAKLRKNLPSWVADWTDRSYIGPGLASDHVSDRRPFTPSTSLEKSYREAETAEDRAKGAGHRFAASGHSYFECARDDHDCLSLPCLKFDEIVSVLGETMDWDPSRDLDGNVFVEIAKGFAAHFDRMDQLVGMYVGLENQPTSLSMYPSGESNVTAYVKTLCAGSMPEYSLSNVLRGSVIRKEETEESLWAGVSKFVSIWNAGTKWRDRFNKMPSGAYELMERVRGFRVDERQKKWHQRGLTLLVQTAHAQFKNQWDTYSQISTAFSPTFRRRFGITKKGYFALVPSSTGEGDVVIIPKGGKLPLVVRARDEKFELIGESYVHGIMFGEAFLEASCESICLC